MRAERFLVLVALLGPGAPAHAESTPLVTDDLSANKRTRIDATDDDDGYDDLLAGGAFNTKAIVAVADKLKGDIQRERLRANPRIVAYVHPARTTLSRLRSMTDIDVEVDLLVDECERSACRESLGRHIQLVGREVGDPVKAVGDYRLQWKTLRIRASTPYHEPQVQTYVVAMPDAITASQRAGGGLSWLDAQERADAAYEPMVTQAIVKNASSRRVSIDGLPSVHRAGQEVTVALAIKGDRVRWQQQSLDALWAVGKALASSPNSPPRARIELTTQTGVRGEKPKRFRVDGGHTVEFAEGKLERDAYYSTYVSEQRDDKDAMRLDFSDDDAAGRPAAPARP